MENRPIIFHLDIITTVINICTQIQNSGLATTFFTFSGHTGQIDYNIHAPGWISGEPPTYKATFYLSSSREYAAEFVRGLQDIHTQLANAARIAA